MTSFVDIIGSIAAFLTTISFLPQAIKTIRTKDTTGISLKMYVLFTVGVIFWLIYGILLKNIFISMANLITVILATTILVVKIINKVQKNED